MLGLGLGSGHLSASAVVPLIAWGPLSFRIVSWLTSASALSVWNSVAVAHTPTRYSASTLDINLGYGQG